MTGFWLWQLTVRHMTDGAEVRVLAYVLWWRDGLLPWTGIDRLPIVINPYGPLYTWLCTWLPAGPPRPYLAGRLLSLTAVATVLALVAFWIGRRTSSRTSAVLAVLLLAGAKPLILFAPLFRVDSLGLALSVAGFCAVTLSSSRRGLAAGILFFLLAFATKSSHVAAPLACFLYLSSRDRRRALTFAAAIIAGFLAIVGGMEIVTGGKYLFNATVGSPLNSPRHAGDMATRPLISLFWILALIAATRGPRLSLPRSPAFLYMAVGWLVAVVFAINPLSSSNFLSEFYIGLALLTGEILGAANTAKRSERGLVWKLLLAHSIVALLWGGHVVGREVREILAYREIHRQVEANLAPRLRAGLRVVVLRSDAGRDVLNAAGAPNRLNAPKLVERSPETEAILHAAVADGDIDAVLLGDELAPLDPP